MTPSMIKGAGIVQTISMIKSTEKNPGISLNQLTSKERVSSDRLR